MNNNNRLTSGAHKARPYDKPGRGVARPRPFQSFGTAILALASLLLVSACQPRADESAAAASKDTTANASADKQLYQCAMHPNVVSDHPGDCPICGMQLQPVKSVDAKGIPGRAPVELSDLQRQLINLRTIAVKSEALTQTLRTTGVIQYDSSKIFTVSAWTSGRIDQLYVNQQEMMIEQGQPLYAIYSPEISATLRDYHLMRAGKDDNASVLDSIRTRLRQHGLTDSMIDQLEAEKAVPDQIDIPSPVAGIVMNKMINLGAYVKKGEPLYTVVDLSKLWLIIEVYENELPFITPGMPVTATTAAVPGRVFHGTVELVNHVINTKTRTAQVRVVFDDPSQNMVMTREADGSMHHHYLLLPDMWMNAMLQRDLGEKLTVPASAIFDTGNRQYVFIEQGEGLFVPVIVTLGPKVGDRQAITNGLHEGDHVVVDGNFLLDSESQLKASASEPAEATKGGPGAPSAASATTAQSWPTADPQAIARLINAYGQIHDALTQDTMTGVAPALSQMQAAVSDLKKTTSTPDGVQTKLSQLATALGTTPPADLESARQQFGEISAALIDLFRNYTPPIEVPLNIVHCPMWSKSPADWLQSGQMIKNPFLGQNMPTCGNIVGKIGEGK